MPAEPWAPYEPDSARPWTAARAAHLLRRAGFGCGWAELHQAVADGPRRTLDRILSPPAGLAEFDRRIDALGATAAGESGNSDAVAQLWLHRMQETPWPLLEKITLFWHDHFAVAGSRVGRPRLMQAHLALLRRHALGRFDAMLGELCRDPAVRLAFDARTAAKGKPPRALAAALLGRWTSGAVPPAPAIDQAARSFTGANILRDQYHEQPADRDPSAPPLDDAVRAALAHPAAARHIAGRLYRWLVSETDPPGPGLLDPLAASFARDFDIGRLAGAILRSNAFFADTAIRQRVKSPVEFAIGIGRALEQTAPPVALHHQLAALGQKLLEPPTSEGWAGGRRWLNRYTVVARSNLAASLLGPAPDAAAKKHGQPGDSFWWQLLLQRDPVPGAPREGRELIHHILSTAEFQLA